MISFARRIKQNGFTLIEIIIFLSVIAFAAVGIISAYMTLLQSAPITSRQMVALGLAQGRMDIIYANRRLNGYPPTDPCTAATPPSVCGVTLSGYSVSSSISSISLAGDPNYSQIIVTSQGPGAAKVVLSLLNAKY